MSGFIGIFDSGYGGFTVLEKMRNHLSKYDFLYLGDNARTPYGPRSFEVIYKFTLQAVKILFNKGCYLVILACNTASVKALQVIQQNDLPNIAPKKKVLGIIRPTVEVISSLTQTRHVGVLGTEGTISSGFYSKEILKLFPDITVTEEACPMWATLVEKGEHNQTHADFFIKKHIESILSKDLLIDVIILGCTHYPLLENKIKKYLPNSVSILSQGDCVAQSLVNYLYRHPEIDMHCSKNGIEYFYTTEKKNKFKKMANIFFNIGKINVSQVNLE